MIDRHDLLSLYEMYVDFRMHRMNARSAYRASVRLHIYAVDMRRA